MYSGPGNSYMSNIPPWEVFVQYLEKCGNKSEAALIRSHLR